MVTLAFSKSIISVIVGPRIISNVTSFVAVRNIFDVFFNFVSSLKTSTSFSDVTQKASSFDVVSLSSGLKVQGSLF